MALGTPASREREAGEPVMRWPPPPPTRRRSSAGPHAEAQDVLGLAERPAPLIGHEPLHPVAAPLAAERLPEPADRVTAQGLGVLRERSELPLQAVGKIRPQPRVGLELERVRGL